MKADQDLHLLNIQELTDLLRNEPGFKELREALAQKGFSANEVLLAVYMEDGDWNEYGAIVTKKGEVYKFTKSTRRNAPVKFKLFRRVKDINRFIQYAGPAIKVALQLVTTGRFF